MILPKALLKLLNKFLVDLWGEHWAKLAAPKHDSFVTDTPSTFVEQIPNVLEQYWKLNIPYQGHVDNFLAGFEVVERGAFIIL
jgi:hypothetical protein